VGGVVVITMLQQPQEPPRSGNRRARLLAAPPQLPVRGDHPVESAQLRGLASDSVVARSGCQHDLHQAIKTLQNLTIRRASCRVFLSRVFPSREERKGIRGRAGTPLQDEHPGGVAPCVHRTRIRAHLRTRIRTRGLWYPCARQLPCIGDCQTGHFARGEATACQGGHFPAQPERRSRPVPPPAVGASAHHVGDVNDDRQLAMRIRADGTTVPSGSLMAPTRIIPRTRIGWWLGEPGE
jgi:hypothetical protein